MTQHMINQSEGMEKIGALSEYIKLSYAKEEIDRQIEENKKRHYEIFENMRDLISKRNEAEPWTQALELKQLSDELVQVSGELVQVSGKLAELQAQRHDAYIEIESI